MIYKAKQFMLIKKIQKHLYILKHDASDVQKGNIEQVIVCIFNMRSSYYIDVSFTILWYLQLYN